MQGPMSFNNIIANSVVIVGPNGEFLVYNPTQASGTLVTSIVGQATTDSISNDVLQGVTSYGSTGSRAVELTNGNIAFLTGPIGGAGPFTTQLLISGSLATNTVQSSQALFLETVSGQLITLASVGANGQVQINNSGLVTPLTNELLEVLGNISVEGDIFSIVGGAEETWHPMTLQNGWINGAGNVTAQYRRVSSPPKSVELIGAISSTAATANQFFQLPVGYRPVSQQGFAAGASGNVAANMAPYVQCDTAGNLTMNSVNALPANGNFRFHGTISLDA